MSRYRLSLRPQGAIPRDTELTLKMQPLLPTSDVVVPGCFLTIATRSPIDTDAESFLVVVASELQAVDMEVVVAALETGSPLSISFLGIGSPPEFDSPTTTVIIPAGSDYVVVPFLAGPTGTGSPPDPVVITASSSLCGDASTEIEIGEIECVRHIRDITYRISSESDHLFGDSIDIFADNKVVNPSLVYGGQAIWYFGVPLPPLYSLFTDDSNEIEFPVVSQFSRIIVVGAIVGKVCPNDVLTATYVGTDWAELTWWPPVGNETALRRFFFQVFAAPYAGSQADQAPAFTVGQTIVISVKLNGVLLPLPRATLTIRFV